MVRHVFPNYLGVVALGVKAGVILPGDDIVQIVSERIEVCDSDGFLDDRDIVCVTESVVARSQENYVTEDDISKEVQNRLGMSVDGHLGVLFPIVSRNRFAAILRGIVKAVPEGKVTVQLSYPYDEVGNLTLSEDYLRECGWGHDKKIDADDLDEECSRHPLTGVNYVRLYQDIINEAGAEPHVFLSNDPLSILDSEPDGIVISEIHVRERTRALVEKKFRNLITLQDIFSDDSEPAWSEWGLLGSNLSSGGKIKLAPRDGDKVAERIKDEILRQTGKSVEVIIYGDGAYKDPTSGIYELADPETFFGLTRGLMERRRTGVKYKWLTDELLGKGISREEIEERIEILKGQKHEIDSPFMEGTTPRRLADVVSSLADLVSGSADAGTPIILVKGMLG